MNMENILCRFSQRFRSAINAYDYQDAANERARVLRRIGRTDGVTSRAICIYHLDTRILMTAFLTLAFVGTAGALPVYEIVAVNLADAAHTRPTDGLRNSKFEGLNDTGQASGTSDRYDATGNINGITAWFYNGTQTINVGLTDAEHTSLATGEQASGNTRLDANGKVSGGSRRYDAAGGFNGLSAWIYDGTSTSNIGLTDAQHTRSINGERESFAELMNNAGQVVGRAQRYGSSGFSRGKSAWLFDGTNTMNIGLTDVEHTSPGTTRSSSAKFLNEAGQVAGTALRYDATGDIDGHTVWLYDGVETKNIGLTDALHTGGVIEDRVSRLADLNAAGQAIGLSLTYDVAGNESGNTGWFYDAATTMSVGLTDAEHTRSTDGGRRSEAVVLNDVGQVGGTSDRYDAAGNRIGFSAWIYDGAGTSNVGLTDAEHTRSTDGIRGSVVNKLNNAGAAAGVAFRFDAAGNETGLTAWYYDGASTANVGLSDIVHTRSTDGWRESSVDFFSQAGHIAGNAKRYNGSGDMLGNAAWLYDPISMQTHVFNLDYGSSDGQGTSIWTWLGDDGFGFGAYSVFDALNNLIGARTFGFDLTSGFFDLEDAIAGGLAPNGWGQLVIPYGTLTPNFQPFGAGGSIVGGSGQRSDNLVGEDVFILTARTTDPIPVPEPHTLTLAFVALLLWNRGRFWGISRVRTTAPGRSAPDKLAN